MTKIVSILTLLLTLSSCNFISSFIHDDEVVARVGNEKLYLSELSSYIPDTVSPEDSTNLAMQYITSWARDLLYLNLAENQLSKAEQDVSSELEDYRRSLLRYRYEQLYVNDRLDTLITDAQIESYYKEHEDYFKLQRPILKVRFLDIMSDSPNAELIIRCMSSDDYSEVLAADSLAYQSALRYFDKSDVWMDAAVLAREFSTDYVTMLASLSDSFIRIEQDGRLRIAFVLDIRRSGTAPVEYASAQIRDNILSDRKHRLLKSLEQDLLKDALEKKKLVIY
ncbi:MAG: hypothetical protein PUB45_01280 [Bacteroidales bacterium]|nr:hypothetical protein [Bacteroidales bacterium]MDY3783518.1 hypothetical protein [Candidatus Cryptobacteroides sp.]